VATFIPPYRRVDLCQSWSLARDAEAEVRHTPQAGLAPILCQLRSL